MLGRELSAKLQAEGIKERNCVVALPLQWVLNFQVELPELAQADVDPFLETEAERNFPYDPASLFISTSRSRFPPGVQYATVAAVQQEQILQLQAALKFAHLKVLSFSPGISALQPPFASDQQPVILLHLGAATVELEVLGGGGVMILRSLNKAVAEEGGEHHVQADVVSRELRVTLGQLPDQLRNSLRTIRIYGRPEEAARLLEDLNPRLVALGLRGELGDSAGHEANPAFALGSAYLLKRPFAFEFLPPKVSAWKQFSSKTSSRKLAWAGGAIAAAALILAGAFIVQNWELSNLRGHWSTMEPKVKDLDDTQQLIRRFRPWFDNSYRNLSILKKLTESFPVDGVVTAQSVDIRDSTQVVCSGVARDNQALFKMLDQLRASKDISDVKMDQIRGKNPLQFSFNFNWRQGGPVSEH
jgi:hypothetical protein